MKYYALLLAAGRGERAGAGVPKQFRLLGDRPLWRLALDALKTFEAEKTLVLFPPGHSKSFEISEKLSWIEGGHSRFESFIRGIQALESMGMQKEDWVLVHDAARPCLHESDLHRLKATCGSSEPIGALLAARVTDTIKQLGTLDKVQKTLDRNTLAAAQTPQLFRAGLLKEGIIWHTKHQTIPTDEAMMIESLGFEPKVIFCEHANIKITYAEDWLLAKAILQSLGRLSCGIE